MLIGTEASRYIANSDPEKQLKTADEIIKKLDEYYAPMKNVTIERHNFNNACQDEGETFSKFLAKINNLASRCSWPISKEEGLRDKIVQGIRDEKVVV